jgi:hypothetical protein
VAQYVGWVIGRPPLTYKSEPEDSAKVSRAEDTSIEVKDKAKDAEPEK